MRGSTGCWRTVGEFVFSQLLFCLLNELNGVNILGLAASLKPKKVIEKGKSTYW